MFKQGAVKQTGVSSAALPLSPALSARSYFIDYRHQGALHCSVGSILNIFSHVPKAIGPLIVPWQGEAGLKESMNFFKRGFMCPYVVCLYLFIFPLILLRRGKASRGGRRAVRQGGARRGGPGKMLPGPGKMLPPGAVL